MAPVESPSAGAGVASPKARCAYAAEASQVGARLGFFLRDAPGISQGAPSATTRPLHAVTWANVGACVPNPADRAGSWKRTRSTRSTHPPTRPPRISGRARMCGGPPIAMG